MKQATEKGSRTICERMGEQRVKREKAAAKSSKSGSINKRTQSPSSLVLDILNTNQQPYKYQRYLDIKQYVFMDSEKCH